MNKRSHPYVKYNEQCYFTPGFMNNTTWVESHCITVSRVIKKRLEGNVWKEMASVEKVVKTNSAISSLRTA